MLSVKNKIISNIFTEEEIDIIYQHIEQAPESKTFYQKDFSYISYNSVLPEKIIDKIKEIVNHNFDQPLVLRELCFARYKIVSGKNPKLYPHYDDTFNEQRVTFDIQVKASIPWNIIIEETPFLLKDNEALIFSGTDQIHWREKVIFKEDDFVDMIFCHFSEENPEKLSLDHYEKVNPLKKMYFDNYYS